MSSIFDWSLTAANNANADSSVNWQEGQLPSTVNDSARAMMTRVAQLLKDIGGTVTAGGTANAITVTANSPFSAHATGEIIGFKASATNTAATTLNVNGIGAKSIRKATMAADTALSGGEIVTGGVYILIYDAALNSAAGGWLLVNPAFATDAFVSLASAATTDLSTVGSQNVTVTGTTTITAFGTAAAGTFRRLVFSGILTLTHNATSLILPQGGNVVTAAGDSLEAVSLGSGNWRVTSYQRVGSSGLVQGTSVAVSGTSVDFPVVPSWAKRVTVLFDGISTNGTNSIIVQIGPSGGVETTGYTSGMASIQGTNATTVASLSSGFLVVNPAVAASSYVGVLTLYNITGNTWVGVSNLNVASGGISFSQSGSKSLAGVFSRLQISAGGNTFDAGSVNIMWE